MDKHELKECVNAARDADDDIETILDITSCMSPEDRELSSLVEIASLAVSNLRRYLREMEKKSG
jgi:hypothetical protein